MQEYQNPLQLRAAGNRTGNTGIIAAVRQEAQRLQQSVEGQSGRFRPRGRGGNGRSADADRFVGDHRRAARSRHRGRTGEGQVRSEIRYKSLKTVGRVLTRLMRDPTRSTSTQRPAASRPRTATLGGWGRIRVLRHLRQAAGQDPPYTSSFWLIDTSAEPGWVQLETPASNATSCAFSQATTASRSRRAVSLNRAAGSLK